MTIATLGSFALVVGLLTLTPGRDTALIIRTASLRTPVRAWGALTSAGVTALLPQFIPAGASLATRSE